MDSTNQSDRLDPEDVHLLLRDYQTVCGRVVAQYGGTVAQYLGDGLLVYFGHPFAHGDDAERAVRAGLAIVEEIGRLNARQPVGQERLAARIGIHSGLTVVAETGGPDQGELAFGQTMNLASRIHGLAQPDSVAISETTLKLVRGRFITIPLGTFELKGIRRPVAVHRVDRPSGVRSRLDTEAERLTPFVGRERELALVLESWERARAGTGQVLHLIGEAGIGKSRLVRALREHLRDQPYSWLECHGSAYHASSPLFPLVDLLQQGLMLDPRESASDQIAKLERALARAEFALDETLPLFATLLGLPLPEQYAHKNLPPNVVGPSPVETLLSWLLRLAKLQPAILAMEDAHWFDPTTLELLSRVVAQAHGAPLLLIITTRSDFAVAGEHHTLALGRLAQSDVREMVESIAGGRSLPGRAIDEILARTDGNPLFVEEFTKAMVADGEPQPRLAVPETLQDLLMARLDQLKEAKGVAQTGAAIGREFSRELLLLVSDLSPERAHECLERLVRAEILAEQRVGGDDVFRFRHALIQDAAYDSLLHSRRRELHRRIGAALRDHFPAIAAASPELVAHHFDLARDYDEAVEYLERAGTKATAEGAHSEMISLYDRALGLLPNVPDSEERRQRELRLLCGKGMGLVATRGYAAPEVEQIYQRASALCEAVGFVRLPVLYGIWGVALARGDRAAVDQVARRFEELCATSNDRSSLLFATAGLGIRALYRGEYARARELLERGTAGYDPELHHQLVREYGYGGGVYGHLYLMWCSWILCLPDDARRYRAQALEIAEWTPEPYTRAVVMNFCLTLAFEAREPDVAGELAAKLLVHAGENQFVLWSATALCAAGWAQAQRGERDAGIAQIQQGLAIYRLTGARLPYAFYLSFLVEAYLGAGKRAEGLAAVDEALALSRDALDCFREPELLRLRGELLALDPADADEAERSFRGALEQSRAAGARLFELRAAASLGRLLFARGAKEEAVQLVAGALAPFSASVEMPELREARDLLGRLGQGS